MFHKGKLLIFLGSFFIVLYGASAAFFGKEAYKELAVFMRVLDKVRDEYVETPDMSKVQDGAMRGLIDALDPYCSFLSKEQYESIQKRKLNSTGSAGLILSKRSDVIYVVSCAFEGPAAKAGIRPGDYVIAVDGQGVEEKSIIEVDSLLHGAEGTKIKLTIFRGSRNKPQDVDLIFQSPVAFQVSSKILQGGVGYLKIASLSDVSVEQAKIKLKTLISAGARKILLDLRYCADGAQANGTVVANYFLQHGVICFSQNRKGEKTLVAEATQENFITDLPTVVLVNGSTAGAAEIVAGALKDNKRAKVVGEKSFGLGSEQKTIQLKSGAILIISVAKYCSPSGKVIQEESARKAGILPDIQSPDNEKRQDLAVESYYIEQDDEKYRQILDKIEEIQLNKALETLLEEELPVKKAA
jgi:carboxyl-terminal processing protease